MYSIVQKLLMLCDAERSHDFSMAFLKGSQHNLLKNIYAQSLSGKPLECLGLSFKNPIGLAAGLDKNAECIDAFDAMGFGFIEVGTTTPLAQFGNDKPRMFRLPQHKAIINRLGFNNKGVDYLVERVNQSNYQGVLGINIGKNKDTPEENAIDDYLNCMRKVYELASYITINISSPNTPGLRNLQYGDLLKTLLSSLKTEQTLLHKATGKYVPLAVKIAPDNTQAEVHDIATALIETGMDAVIATNTTLARDSVLGHKHADEMGGLSGAVLTKQSNDITQMLSKALNGAMPIIGVGGISNAQDAAQRYASGARLLQVYSSFIYQGPPLLKELTNV
ncbi:dihydroorotate dehydrogenase [Glaciecola punicea ACAM 611]|uniref:Dihydroorotate dehydrogenase (quinone) n=1 Tax=Glaciecola punicea ACAM 611 TaxID=1121923 RepID=H5T9G5_9ALTE|nr:quinone-dependent dihydroorotate dehydrogenase [Glaciecola punicea]GAB54942.1 dihydroorotate dehydrogenase [Glaciecola punicea ACAM 611]